MLKSLNWIVTLLLLLVSGQIQAATWTDTLAPGSVTFEYDDATSPASCSVTDDNAARVSLQYEMGDVGALTYASTVDCSDSEQYIVVKNNGGDYWQVHIKNGTFQGKQQLWAMTSSSEHTLKWSKGSATREFTYNPPGPNAGDPDVSDNCPTFNGVGIAETSGNISTLNFSSPASCNSNDRQLLLKISDKTYWQVSIKDNEIDTNDLETCDEVYYYLHEATVVTDGDGVAVTDEDGLTITVDAGCSPPQPILTKFTDVVASGVEDNAGMTISYATLLNKSDASLAKTSLDLELGSVLYFSVESALSTSNNITDITDPNYPSYKLLINGAELSDTNKKIGPGDTVTYRPGTNINNLDFDGVDENYEVDALRLSVNNDLDHISDGIVTAHVSLSPVNDPPRKLTGGSIFVGKNTSSTLSQGTLRAVDDIDTEIGSENTDHILFKLVSTPSRGSLLNSDFIAPLGPNSTFTQTDINNGKISYENSAGGTSDSFTLKIEDNSGLSDNVSFAISITIIQADRGSPIISQQGGASVIMSENSTPNPFSVTLNATNPAGGDSLMIWRLKTPPSNGQAEVFGLGRSPNDEPGEFVRYEPTEDWDGTDSFSVVVNNGSQGESTVVINVTVNHVNAAPLIEQGSSYGVTMSEDASPTAFTATISATDRDQVENNTTLFWDVGFHPLHGTVTLNNTTGASPTINYSPTNDYYGSDSFGLTVSDGSDTTSIRVPIYITPQNDAPTVTEGSNITVTMSEDGTPTPFELTLNATDVEGDDISWSISTQPGNGSVGLIGSEDGREITYTPQSDFVGLDSFVITVSDPNGGSTSTTILVDVQPLNDAPTITQGDSVTVDMTEEGATPFSLTLDAIDLDNDTLQWSILSQPSHGSATVSVSSGISTGINYSPDTDYFGADSFIVQVSDGTLSDTIMVNVNVENINDPPVIQEGNSISKTVIEDTELTINLTAVDSDSNVTWQVLQQPNNGNIDFLAGFNSPKRVRYTPTLNFNGSDSFQVAVSDGEFSDQITVNITVATSNDAPYFREGLQTNVYISEDSFPTAFRLTLNGLDNEGDELSWSVDTPPSHGTAGIIVPLGNGRAIDYVPDTNYYGTDSFIIKISDSFLSNTFQVNVTVEPNDDAPMVQNPLADLTFQLGETITQVPIGDVFADVDSDDDAITTGIFLNDNENLVTASVSGDLLTLSYSQGVVGTANISLLGVSGGKSVQDNFSITIEDLVVPVFSNLPLEELTYEATGLQTPINPAAPNATDATSVVVSSDKPSQLAFGTHTINWIATDSSGNTATTSQIINIVDTTPPQLNLNSQTVTASATGTSGNSVDLGIVQATDLVDGSVLPNASVPLNGSFATLDIGQHTIVWQATDANGNTATQEQVVNVVDTTPPQIILPSPTLTVSADHPTNNSVDLGVVTANDIIDGALTATTSTSLNGTVATLPIGQHIIIWQATDAAGNTASQEQAVNVADTTPPQITLESPVVTINASTQNSNNVDLGLVTTTDLIDGSLTATTTNTLLNGTMVTLPVGQHTIIWQATDTNGNTATQEQIVNVVDNTPPQIILENPIITVNASTQNNNSINLGLVTASDLIDGNLAATTDTPLNGTEAILPIGQHSIMWQATDASGNTATKEQIVNVVDTGYPLILVEKPIITVSAISQNNNSVDLGTVTASDLIDGNLNTTTDTPLTGTVATLPIGQHIITWQATDTSGNTTSQQQVVSVVDNTPPQITLESDFITVSANHPNSNSVDLGTVTANDVVDGTLIPTANTPLIGMVATLSIGQHTIIWQAIDENNNQVTTEQIVNVIDTTLPVITLENATITVSASSQINNDVDLGTVTANDLIDGVLTATANIPLNGTVATLPAGQHVITWQATDSNGNTATQDQLVNVVDNTPPQITLSNPLITASANSQNSNSVDLGTVAANDLVDGALIATTITPLNGTVATLSIGQHTIIWQATDANGNTTNQEQVVTVIDTTPPQITLGNAVITVNAGSQNNNVDLGTVTAIDQISGALIATTTTPLNGNVATLPVGQHTIIWQATDANGNTITKEQIVNVVDTTSPQITLSNSVLTVSAVDSNNNSVDLGTVVANDAVDGVLTATPDVPLNGTVATLPIGQHTVTWQVTDSSGNTAVKDQTVNVVDVTPPQITLSNPVIRVDGIHPDNNSIDLGTVTASDQVDGSLNATTGTSLNGMVATLPIGQHIIFWQATDASGNTVTQEQTVNVVDNTQIINTVDTIPPQIVLGSSVITFNATNRNSNNVDLGNVIANDLADGALIATANIPLNGSVATLPIGQHTIIWQATDVSGNTATQEQTVNVVDTNPPEITLENATITVIANSKESNDIDLGSVSANDLIDGTLTATTSTSLNGTTASLPVGQHTITWKATDASGNTATQEQTVIVVDTKQPQITLSHPIITTTATSQNNNNVDLGTVTASDLIDGILTATTTTPLNGTVATFSVGQHTVFWEAADTSGNLVRTAQIVNVVDNAPPQITLEKPTITINADGRNNTIDLGDVTAVDLIDGSVTATTNIPLNGSTTTLQVGQHIIIWQATDATGNAATKEQFVSVVDNTPPQITLPNSIITVTASSRESNHVDLGVVTANDLVDGVLTPTASTTLNGTVTTLPIGLHTIVWQATDASGNISTEEQLINVVDNTPPQITLPNSIITVNASSQGDNRIDLGVVTANDLIDGALVVTTSTPLDGTVATLSVGQHTIVWQATDSSGNTSTQTQIVNVIDSESPIISVSNIVVEATDKITIVTAETLSNSVSTSDATDGEIAATPEIPLNGELPIGTHTVIWQVTDSDGNQASASQLVKIQDTTPPELLIDNLAVTLNATGELTTVNTSDLGVSASDLVDDAVTIIGEVNGEALPSNLFESGVHYINWYAQDAYGNRSGVQEQTVSIVPLVNFGPAQLVSAGDTVTVKLILTGIAPVYPVTVNYEINASVSEGVANIDHNATPGSLTLEYPNTEGTFIFYIAEFPVLNGLGEGKLVFSLGALDGVIKGYNETHIVEIINENIPVTAEGHILLQGGKQVSSFVPNGGLATILMSDPTKELLFTWVVGDMLTDLDSNPDTYTFDPSIILVGNYVAEVSTTNSDGQIINNNIYFNVTNTSLDNVIDSNGNGIPDIQDIESSTNLLPVSINDNLDLFLLSEAGTQVRLGSFATIRGDYNAIVQPGENGLPAIPSSYTSVLDTYNYQINNIASGGSIEAIIPQNHPIPEEALYLVFNKDINSWLSFEENSQNKIASAPYDGNSNICPPLGDNRYVSGLVAGNYCVSLTVVDGGNNDADGSTNRTISNVGVVASNTTNVNNDNSNGSNNIPATESGGGGGEIPLETILLFVSMLLFQRHIRLRVTRTKR